MRDPLTEPRPTPVRLRRRPVHTRLAAAAEALYAMLRQQDEPWPGLMGAAVTVDIAARELTPPTLRGLIRSARAAGVVLKFQLGGADFGIWSGTSPDQTWTVDAAKSTTASGLTWSVSVEGPKGNATVHFATEDRIAAAARLCGWELGAS